MEYILHCAKLAHKGVLLLLLSLSDKGDIKFYGRCKWVRIRKFQRIFHIRAVKMLNISF